MDNLSLAQDIFDTLIKDPDLEIQEGQTREEAAKSEAEYRARQYNNNVEALSLANEPIGKLLQHLIKYNDIKDTYMKPHQIFKNILKGSVNDKKFTYDDKGLDEAINHATQLMRDKKSVNFEWDDSYQEKNLGGDIIPDEDTIEEERDRLSPSQQREFDRQISESLRRKGKRFKKSMTAMEKVQYFFKNN